MLSLYFDPSGRIKRSTWWLHAIIILVGGIALVFVSAFTIGYLGALAGMSLRGIELLAQLVYWIVVAIAAWCGFALSVKRLHDTDKSAWWILLSLVPLISLVWLCMVGFQDSAD